MRLQGRVSKLEQTHVVPKVWRQVIQKIGQTQEQAIAEHEAANGPLGDDACLIVRIMTAPTLRGVVGHA